MFSFLRGLSDLFMIKIIADNRRIAKRRVMKIIIPCVYHTFFGSIRPDFLIQCLPVVTAFLRIDLTVQLIKLWMMFMYPVQDPFPVISAQVQVFQPYHVALAFCTLDNFDHVCDARKDWRNKAGGLDASIVELLHG